MMKQFAYTSADNMHLSVTFSSWFGEHFRRSGKQVDILISKNQALQILYLKNIKLHKLATIWIETHENLIPTNDTVQFYCYITIINKTSNKTYLTIGQQILSRFLISFALFN